LKASKTRTQKSIDELNRRIREQDFSKPIKNTIVYDREGNRLKVELAKVKNEFEDLKAKNTKKTIGDYLVKMEKILSAFLSNDGCEAWHSGSRENDSRAGGRDYVGGVLSKIPGISKVAAKLRAKVDLVSKVKLKRSSSCGNRIASRESWRT
jgi:hypothetical protein